jgi:cyclic 2,3-diphosphoglycerate synthase
LPVPGTAKVARQLPDALALIDGEHYPPVVRAALDRLAATHHIVAALFLGGAEKLRGEAGIDAASTATYPSARMTGADPADGQVSAARAPHAGDVGGPLDGAPVSTDQSDVAAGSADGPQADLARQYGVPLLFLDDLVGSVGARGTPPESSLPTALQEALRRCGAAEVVDLSDEPVLGYRERFLLMSAAAAAGVAYVGADFELRPQARADVAVAPSLAVIGTGKRVGKTAISGALARSLADAGERVVVVAMGRGGPPEPEVVLGGRGVGPADLLAASRQGRHAASDHFEDAALAGVTTIGCGRCGGGLAGAAFDSNVPQALALLDDLEPGVVLFEGSGSVVPPVRVAATVCVVSAAQPADYITGYLGTFRLLTSDLLILTMCEPPFASAARLRRLLTDIARTRPDLPVVPTVFRPRPLADVRGRRVAYFTTAAPRALPALTAHLAEAYGAEVVVACADLARRPALAEAVARAQAKADVFLTEIKAAAIDVVAEAAAGAHRELVFCDNEALPLPGHDLAAALDCLVDQAKHRYAVSGARHREGRPRHGV